MKKKHLLYLSIAGSMVLYSCGGDEKPKEDAVETKTEGIQLSEAEMQKASEMYFDKCAGCHGSSRKGATGPHLLPDAPEGDKAPGTKLLGDAGLRAFIENGTPGGMPEWKGVMTDEEISLMVKFLQVDPPAVQHLV